MSFRLFIYYCALVGAWTGIVGWVAGRFVALRLASADSPILQDGVRGLALGAIVTLGLGLIDSLWNIGRGKRVELLSRLTIAVIVGGLGGLIGGAGAQWLVSVFGNSVPVFVFYGLGWTIAGVLMGAAIASFEWIAERLRGDVAGPAKSKILKCSIGGGIGGLVGSMASNWLRDIWLDIFQSKDPLELWSPTAIGFAALGLFIGLLVGLAQVLLKTTWVRVEAGFRPGRELILSRLTTRIGRAEDSEIAMFGDPGVDMYHAQIVRDTVRYVVEDAGSQGGTYVNDKRIKGRTALHSGDVIRVGKSVLRFSEKGK